MLINSVAGGGEKEAGAVAYASENIPIPGGPTNQGGVRPIPGNPVLVHSIFNRNLNTGEAEPDYVFGQGYVGYSNWGYVLIRGANLLGEGVEATFVVPEGSALGAGKKIRVRFYVDAWYKSDKYWSYGLMIKVLESEVTASSYTVFDTQMIYAKENLVLE